MAQAAAAAAPTRPHPNPRVGALVLDRAGSIVAQAAHEGPGLPHAERAALDTAAGRAAGGVLVVTLEPCVHHGRTPPCVDAIIAAGVAEVVVGAGDPDPRVAGRGIARLRTAGITVREGVAADVVEAMDPGYFHHRRTGRPLVTLKEALTVDGQAAAADGTSQWITGREARADAHRLRAAADAVVVGAGTVRADDPRLTVRLAGWDGPQPIPVVVAGSAPLPPDAAVFTRKALVYAPRPLDVPAEVVVLPGERGVDLAAMVRDLGERGMLDVLVEGGPTIAAAMLRAGLVDRAVVYLGALLAGGAGRGAFAGDFATLGDAVPVTVTGVRALDGDVRLDLAVGPR